MPPDNLPGQHPNSSPGNSQLQRITLSACQLFKCLSLLVNSVNTLPTAEIPRILAVYYDTEKICPLRKDESSAGCYSNYNPRSQSLSLSHSSLELQNITICNECGLLYTGGHREEIHLIDQDQCGEQGRSEMVQSS